MYVCTEVHISACTYSGMRKMSSVFLYSLSELLPEKSVSIKVRCLSFHLGWLVRELLDWSPTANHGSQSRSAIPTIFFIGTKDSNSSCFLAIFVYSLDVSFKFDLLQMSYRNYSYFIDQTHDLQIFEHILPFSYQCPGKRESFHFDHRQFIHISLHCLGFSVIAKKSWKHPSHDIFLN